MGSINTWTLLAGLGLFLYGISLMEKLTTRLAGRSFKLFLRRQTTSPVKAILGGTVITGLIQSSSVVILVLMSFVESGIISFQNAFAVLIGSNLGTTLDSWFIATVGFTFNIQLYSLPVIAVTAIIMFFTKKRKKLYDTMRILFAVGVLLLGFGFMKDGAEHIVSRFHLADYNHYNPVIILFIGFVLTVLIQSSSATVAIVLTALYTHALDFNSAACMIIGSETGTTIKFLFTSINGNHEKKLLAWGDFIFNVFTTVLAFSMLPWIIAFIRDIIKIHDPMIGLVFFQSFINFISILICIPFFRAFSNVLEKMFRPRQQENNFYTGTNQPAKEGIASEVLQKAALNILQRVIGFHKKIFVHNTKATTKSFWRQLKSYARVHGKTDEEYLFIKESEGNIIKYYTGLLKEAEDEKANDKIRRYINSVRQSIHAAKSVHDIRHNLQAFQSSANNILFTQISLLQQEWEVFSARLLLLIHNQDIGNLKSELEQLMSLSLEQFEKHEYAIEAVLSNKELDELDGSTLLNVHQECLSSKKALIRALALLSLESPGIFTYTVYSTY